MTWEKLRPMPRVAPWNKGKRSMTWEDRCAEYSRLTKSPITITAELLTPVIHAEKDRTHLDGVLTFAALTTHPVASSYESHTAVVIPLPLDLAWVSPNGKPLWACSPLVPIGAGVDSREYWHKRYPTHRAEFGDRLNAVTTAGRWKEYRVPVNAQSVDRLVAHAVGNAPEVEKLLSVVTHIGKKGSMGYGRVARWIVAPATHTITDVLALKAVPVAYFDGQQPSDRVALNRAWTPPYWYAPWWSDCVVPA